MKQIKLIFLLSLIAGAVNAQFFGRLKPITPPAAKKTITFTGTTVTPTDSTFFSLRPIITGGITLTKDVTRPVVGTGISYQNITYNYATGKFYCNYAISALVLGGGSIAATNPTDIMSGGLMVSFLNNNVGVGIALTHQKAVGNQKEKYVVGPMFTYNINFNN